MKSNNTSEDIKSRHLGVISNSRIKIPRQHCPYSKEKGKCHTTGIPKCYKTRWQLLHHLLTHHVDEPDFKREYERICKLVKGEEK